MIELDKKLHFGISFFLIILLFALIRNIWLSALIVFIIGLLKELYDGYYNYFCKKDLLANILGILLGMLLIYLRC
jgi:VanZ family protein